MTNIKKSIILMILLSVLCWKPMMVHASELRGIIYDGIGFRYINDDGSIACNCRRSVNGTAFHFNELGYADKTGFDACKGIWKNTKKGKRYFFDDGKVPSGVWLLSDGKFYTFDDNGYVISCDEKTSLSDTSTQDSNTAESQKTKSSDIETKSTFDDSLSSNIKTNDNDNSNSSSKNTVYETLPVDTNEVYGSEINGYYRVEALMLNRVVNNKSGGYKEWSIVLAPVKENKYGRLRATICGIDSNGVITSEKKHLQWDSGNKNKTSIKNAFTTNMDIVGFDFQ